MLEDVIIENKQAIEMANVYSGILSGMTEAFASIVSNNLNIVMKFLATVTIVMSIPTMIFSAYGMNVNLKGMPFASHPRGICYCNYTFTAFKSDSGIYLFQKEFILISSC